MSSTKVKTDSRTDDVSITSRLLNFIFDMPVEQKLELLNIIDNWGYEGARRHQRRPWTVPIDYSTDDQSYKDIIKDISASGLFIETQMPFSVGRDVKMKFRLNEGRKLIQISGEIVRVASQGIGVKFKKSNG